MPARAPGPRPRGLPPRRRRRLPAGRPPVRGGPRRGGATLPPLPQGDPRGRGQDGPPGHPPARARGRGRRGGGHGGGREGGRGGGRQRARAGEERE